METYRRICPITIYAILSLHHDEKSLSFILSGHLPSKLLWPRKHRSLPVGGHFKMGLCSAHPDRR